MCHIVIVPVILNCFQLTFKQSYARQHKTRQDKKSCQLYMFWWTCRCQLITNKPIFNVFLTWNKRQSTAVHAHMTPIFKAYLKYLWFCCAPSYFYASTNVSTHRNIKILQCIQFLVVTFHGLQSTLLHTFVILKTLYTHETGNVCFKTYW